MPSFLEYSPLVYGLARQYFTPWDRRCLHTWYLLLLLIAMHAVSAPGQVVFMLGLICIIELQFQYSSLFWSWTLIVYFHRTTLHLPMGLLNCLPPQLHIISWNYFTSPATWVSTFIKGKYFMQVMGHMWLSTLPPMIWQCWCFVIGQSNGKWVVDSINSWDAVKLDH